MRVITNFIIVISIMLFSNSLLAAYWTEYRNITLTQSQRSGSTLYIWAKGDSWFPPGHACADTKIVLLVPNPNHPQGYDQMFSQVLMAHAAGKKVNFGTIENCESGTVHLRADFIRVSD